MLASEINVGPEINKEAYDPAQCDPGGTSDQAHGAGFGEEQAAHVRIARAESLHDSDFAPAFEDGHHQRIYYADRSHRQGQTSEDREKPVEHGKELAHTAGRVDNRESTEP